MNDPEADGQALAPDSAAEGDALRRRIAELERRRRSVDELNRFQVEAYKARLAELKQAEARHLADKQALAGRLEELQRRHDALAREVERLKANAAGGERGDKA